MAYISDWVIVTVYYLRKMKIEELEKLKVDPDSTSVYLAINNAVNQLYSFDAAGRTPLVKPDYPYEYEDRWHEACYTARYMYAYSYEYLQMFKEFLNMVPEVEDLRVASLGCGSMVDAWSLHRAIYTANRDIAVRYYGVDIVSWESKYIPKVTTFKSLKFVNDKAGKFLLEKDKIDYDVIIFPKSIGDIYADHLDFQRVIDALGENSNRRFYLLTSKITYAGSSMRNDEHLLKIASDRIIASGFCLNKKKKKKGEDVPIKNRNNGYIYPVEIDINEVKRLSGRYPILRRSFENYSIYEFVRKGKI